ncbi:MAG: hypothetical protein M1830_000072 [Pleopsidium flavum]|nr:MAG: hypothetical protein M1830_000072 [Pleopsidium flavum]
MPVIITAFENYEVMFQPFLTFRHSRKEACRFRNTLKIQQTAFENECRLLLSAVTRQQDEMLRNPIHNLWRDHNLAKQLGAYMRDSLETCVSTLDLIHDTLTEIDKETRGGFGDLQKSKEDSGKHIFSVLQQKLKLSFSKPRLEEKVDKLRKYNGDLRVLSRQVKCLAEEPSNRPSRRAMDMTTAQYQTVRKASQKLYETLSSVWSCAAHMEHSANICLDEDDRNRNQVILSKVRFNMAFTFAETQDSHTTKDPLWLTIESAFEQTEEPTNRPVQPEGTAAYTLTAALQSLDIKAKKSVSFVLPPAPNASATHQASSSFAALDNTSLDLCSREDVCLYIHERLRIPAMSSPCIGFLQKTRTFKHFVYPPQASHCCVERVISLNDALMAAKTSQYGIPIPDKLRLARLLSLAVLQFHSTPWLQEGWRSRDVYFFNSEDLSDSCLQAPYLSAPFSKDPGAAIRQVSRNQVSSQSPLSLGPNSILFGLGVVLLELGFEAPIQDLQQPEERTEGLASEFTNYRTARRLSKAVSSKVSSRYGKLVNKCLYCDFGLGGSYELEDTELQSAFFQDVVCELDKCLNAALIC